MKMVDFVDMKYNSWKADKTEEKNPEKRPHENNETLVKIFDDVLRADGHNISESDLCERIELFTNKALSANDIEKTEMIGEYNELMVLIEKLKKLDNNSLSKLIPMLEMMSRLAEVKHDPVERNKRQKIINTKRNEVVMSTVKKLNKTLGPEAFQQMMNKVGLTMEDLDQEQEEVKQKIQISSLVKNALNK